MRTIAVIDYGMGNLHSVAKAIEHVAGAEDRVVVSSRSEELHAADRLVFPGVGAMRDCMGEIRRLGLDELLREQVQRKPVLAVCVGMQALLEHSEENGGVDCIGLFKGQVRRFPAGHKDAQGCELKVPHMGWNEVRQTAPHPLWAGIPDGCRFYFVHSYYVSLADPAQEVGQCDYHAPFTVAIAQPNLFAVQFHPEKSQEHGLRLYKNFLSWDGNN